MKTAALVAAWCVAGLLLLILGPGLREWAHDAGLRWWHWLIVVALFGMYRLAKDIDQLRGELQALRRAVDTIRRDDA